MVRCIGMNVHHKFAWLMVDEDGRVRDEGRMG